MFYRFLTMNKVVYTNTIPLVNSCLQVKHMHITTQVNTMFAADC